MIEIQAVAPDNQQLDDDLVQQTLTLGLEGKHAGEKVLVLIPDFTRTITLPQLFRYLVTMILGMAFGFVAKENHFMTGAIIGAFFASLALWQSISERVFIVIAPMIFGARGWYFFHVRDQDSVALLILGVAGLATLGLAIYFLLGNGWPKAMRSCAQFS